mmetsp:Transcript_46728/g.47490  ORF Transcript_46728/g.47490 Transcript_46728/m.47490 type:complete len:172 (+) Transcript_46728:233-748(+)
MIALCTEITQLNDDNTYTVNFTFELSFIIIITPIIYFSCKAIALETGMVTFSQFFAIVNSLLANFSSRSRLIRNFQKQQNEALSQGEWMDLAERIDNIQGNDIWRSKDDSQLYERDRISARIDEFVHLMRRQDIFELMFVLRGGIGRNKFGLLHEGLFSKAMAGTKVLVET